MTISKITFPSAADFFARALCVPAAVIFAVNAWGQLSPPIAIDFNNPTANAKARLNITSATLSNESPEGASALHFVGDPQGGATWTTKLGGPEISVSFWIRADEKPNGDYRAANFCEIGLGYATPSQLRVNTEKTEEFGIQRIMNDADSTVSGGERWHHVAYVVSTKDDHFHNFFDGQPQSNGAIGHRKKSPVANILTPLGKNFKGDIAGIRIWTRCASDEELLSFAPNKTILLRYENAFSQAALKAENPAFKEWCRRIASSLGAYAQGKDMRVEEWSRLMHYHDQLPQLEKWASEIPSSQLPCLPLSIYPYDGEKRLPDLLPYDGVATEDVALSAAKGEIESAAVMLYPLRDLKGFLLKAGDLKGPGGATIPASAVDIKIVKVWHTPRGSWNHYYFGGRPPELTPELLVYDDNLVRVNARARSNELRVNYPDGTRYIDAIDEPEDFISGIEPVFDATTLQPLPLEDGSLKEFWITVRVPQNAAPGDYTSEITLYENAVDPAYPEGDNNKPRFDNKNWREKNPVIRTPNLSAAKSLGSLKLKLHVYPYALPVPRTRYNIDREFIASVMNNSTVAAAASGMGSIDCAERRILTVYENLRDHNFLHPLGPGDFSTGDESDLGLRGLSLMQKAGLPCRPMFNGGSCHIGWVAGLMSPGPRYSPETDPDKYYAALAEFKEMIDRRVAVTDKFLGHRNNFAYGWDEAGLGTCRLQLPFWNYMMEQGEHIFATTAPYPLTYVIEGCDQPSSIRISQSVQWHRVGNYCFSYAAPFITPENPDISRRHKGIRMYAANYDGVVEYLWDMAENTWNEFIYRNFKYRNFCCVYQTFDGLLDTVQWDALREGVDDIRYISLMRLRARAVMNNPLSKPADILTAKRAVHWFESHDADEFIDLTAMRRQVADFCAALPPCQEETLTSGFHFAAEEKLRGNETLEPTASALKLGGFPLTKATFKTRAEGYALLAKFKKDGLFIDALPTWEKICSLPNVPSAERVEDIFAYSEALLKARERDKAAEVLVRITKMPDAGKANITKAHIRMGLAYLKIAEYAEKITDKRIADAAEAFEKAAALSGLGGDEYYAALNTLYDAYTSAGKHAEALELVDTKILKLPNCILMDAYMRRGKSLKALKRYKEALAAFERAAKSPGIAKDCHGEIAKVAIILEDWDRTQRAYADFITFCSKRDESDEYKNTVRELSRYTDITRRLRKTATAEDVFDNDDNDLMKLDLDDL